MAVGEGLVGEGAGLVALKRVVSVGGVGGGPRLGVVVGVIGAAAVGSEAVVVVGVTGVVGGLEAVVVAGEVGEVAEAVVAVAAVVVVGVGGEAAAAGIKFKNKGSFFLYPHNNRRYLSI